MSDATHKAIDITEEVPLFMYILMFYLCQLGKKHE